MVALGLEFLSRFDFAVRAELVGGVVLVGDGVRVCGIDQTGDETLGARMVFAYRQAATRARQLNRKKRNCTRAFSNTLIAVIVLFAVLFGIRVSNALVS